MPYQDAVDLVFAETTALPVLVSRWARTSSNRIGRKKFREPSKTGWTQMFLSERPSLFCNRPVGLAITHKFDLD